MTDLPPPDDRPTSRYGTTTSPTGYGDDRATRGYVGPRRRAAAWYRLIALIWLIVAVIDVVIAARFLGLLLGASTESAFVSFVYGVSAPLVAPFQGISSAPLQPAPTCSRSRAWWRSSSTRCSRRGWWLCSAFFPGAGSRTSRTTRSEPRQPESELSRFWPSGVPRPQQAFHPGPAEYAPLVPEVTWWNALVPSSA